MKTRYKAIEARHSRAVALTCQSEVKEMLSASATCASACLGNIKITATNAAIRMAAGWHDPNVPERSFMAAFK